jgi:glycosyltransferase involved in cell wall biosynthesis
MKTILVEGWRFLPHSYAVVNQFQCLELMRRADVRLFHRDLPYLGGWRPLTGVFDPEHEALIREIPAPPRGLKPDAVLRMGVPHQVQASGTGAPTFVFGTTEFLVLEKAALPGGARPRDVLPGMACTLVPPSDWAARGFIISGAPPERVKVVRSGVDPAIFKPAAPQRRAELRQRLGWEGRFVLLNVSAMTTNKGLGLLMQAVADLARDRPNLLLVLKGSDTVFRSQSMAQEQMAALPHAAREALLPRLSYTGGLLTNSGLAELYQAADAYVAPYLAEGFNMPVLEAGACGLAVICTRGGPTDEFVDDAWCQRIASRQEHLPDGRTILMPDAAHLASLISGLVGDEHYRASARQAGPAWVQGRMTWKHTIDRLLEVMFPPQT